MVRKAKPSYQEFYLLGGSGIIDDYPTSVTVGEPFSVEVGIKNHQSNEHDYIVLAAVDGRAVGMIDNVYVDPDGSWEDKLVMRINRPGLDQKVDIFLVDREDLNWSKKLTLWVDVLDLVP